MSQHSLVQEKRASALPVATSAGFERSNLRASAEAGSRAAPQRVDTHRRGAADSDAGSDLTAIPLCFRSHIDGAGSHDASAVVFQPKPAGPAAPAKKATPAPALSVDKIKIVDSASGAIGGYAAVTSGNLNSPGPWNSSTSGGVSNVHQIHFHLDNGDSANLAPTRIVRGSNWMNGVEHKHPLDQVLPAGQFGPPTPGGFGGFMDTPDGPAAHEIQRPATDSLVVADGPGVTALGTSQFPYVHQSTFGLTVSAADGTAIARIRYGVHISKTSKTNVPNDVNTITSIEKRDLVRNKAL